MMAPTGDLSILGRPPLPLGPVPHERLVARPVLVTGAGGSIGSALAEALAEAGAAPIVLLDRSRHRLARTVQRLALHGGGARVRPVVGDAGDVALLDQLFRAARPELVFHAAALKHLVPLETHPLAAFRCNVLAALEVSRAAARHGVRQLVHLSSDKAVEPTSVLGASKRTAEILLAADRDGVTSRVTLRLCNVLGSSGSVLPRFRRRARAGRSLGLTHPEARRYFVTTGEAVTLLLHAALAGEAGDILVPAVPTATRIRDLAERVRLLHQCAAPVTVVGLRPGEKVEERLHAADETLDPSQVEGLLRVRSRPTRPAFPASLGEALVEAVQGGDAGRLLQLLRAALPGYRPSPWCQAAAMAGAIPA